MPHDWNIRPRGSACETCLRPFVDGEVCVSSIRSERDDAGAPILVRSDRCRDCAKAAPAQDAISVWQSPYHAPEPPPPDPAPRQTVESLLRRLMEGDDAAERQPAIYILAVMLERKRVLLERDVRTQPDGTVMRLYEHRRTGEVFLVNDPGLRLDQLEPVQREVADLLSAPTPDSPKSEVPSPKSEVPSPKSEVPSPKSEVTGSDSGLL